MMKEVNGEGRLVMDPMMRGRSRGEEGTQDKLKAAEYWKRDGEETSKKLCGAGFFRAEAIIS